MIEAGGVEQEHLALVRLWGQWQQRADKMVESLVQEHRSKVQKLEGQVTRLRAQLMVQRTGLLWGISHGLHAYTRKRASQTSTATEASSESGNDVLCRTGCMGHAHSWLGPEGQCRLQGKACEHVTGVTLPCG